MRTQTSPLTPSQDLGVHLVESASLALMEMTLTAMSAVPDVSVLQFRTLLALEQHAAGNLTTLADRLDMSLPSASRVVDRLEEAGLVRRRVAEHSKREITLTLTAKGQRTIDTLRSSRRRSIARVLADMRPGESMALVAGLEAFAAFARR